MVELVSNANSHQSNSSNVPISVRWHLAHVSHCLHSDFDSRRSGKSHKDQTLPVFWFWYFNFALINFNGCFGNCKLYSVKNAFVHSFIWNSMIIENIFNTFVYCKRGIELNREKRDKKHGISLWIYHFLNEYIYL